MRIDGEVMVYEFFQQAAKNASAAPFLSIPVYGGAIYSMV